VLKPRPKAAAASAAVGPILVEDMNVDRVVEWLGQLQVNEQAIKTVSEERLSGMLVLVGLFCLIIGLF